MGQLSQFVLLASIVASCISHSIDTTKDMPVPEPPVEPSESDFSEFPTEFMKKLIATLSPEQLADLQKPKTLWEKAVAHRVGNIDDKPCRRHQDDTHYYEVMATDDEHYFVVNVPTENYQPVLHFACGDQESNGTVYDNKCEPTERKGRFTAYCCRQGKARTFLYVIPKPTKYFERRNGTLFLKGENNEYVVYTTIKKEVELNSDCICANNQSEIAYRGRGYHCPKSDSSTNKI